MGNPFQTYGVLPVIYDHTMLPATRAQNSYVDPPGYHYTKSPHLGIPIPNPGIDDVAAKRSAGASRRCDRSPERFVLR